MSFKCDSQFGKTLLCKPLYSIILIGFFVLLNTNLFAQTSDDSLKVELDPIKITAIRSTINAADAPLSLSTYSRDLSSLNASSSLSLNSVGDQLPGLWVNDRHNYALGERLTIRGVGWRAAFGVRGIQVVYNNIPLTVADGQTMINIVEPAFIRRAELVRGPAATYWGNSSGGVLYLSTQPNYEEESSVRVRTMAGSFGMRKGEAEVAISNPGHNMSIYSSYLSSEGFRNYSAADIFRGGLQGSIKLTSRSQLKYQAATIYMPKAQHPSSLTKQQARNTPRMAKSSFVSSNSGKSITQAQAGASYMLQTPAGLLNITGYSIYRDLSNPLPFGIITVNRWAGGLRGTLDKSWDNFDLQVGVESKLQNDDRTEFENAGKAVRGEVTVDQVERVWNQAIFANGTYSMGNINIMGGLRFDRLTFSADTASSQPIGQRSFQSLSPSVGINYQSADQTYFLNISTSFEAPTTTELVNRPGDGNGFNPNLRPEKTLGLELGARGSNSRNTLNYDIAVYRLWITDLLFPYQLKTDGPTYYRNQGQTNHTGIEARIAWNMNRDWSISTTTNISRAKFKKAQTLDSLSLAGKDVPGIPGLRVNSKLKWNPETFLASISYDYVSSYAANNLNSAKNESYGVIDLEFSYQLFFNNKSGTIQPFVNINNILDSRYNSSVVVNAYGGTYYEPAPGRNWQAGISVDF